MHRLLPLAGLLLAGIVVAQNPAPYQPKIMPASNEPDLAMKKIRLPDGLKVSLFAAEPRLANPVAFSIDDKGRVYVAETFRLHAGVTDIRGHMNWLDDDLACRTVADRDAMLKKYLGKNYPTYEKHHDRVRLIEDTDGDGKADRDSVFADGFKDAVTGIGSGVLARHGKVWYTNLPDLWLLQDTKGTGVADVRQSLQQGYGVRVGFIGHDLHGLAIGMDGKLYFSIGDRGLSVKQGDKLIASPDTGAVLRCNQDGSELEIVHTGLRNPQELAFDQYGNLFTGDNNCDRGDQARWVHILDGGDSGWRIGYQFLDRPNSGGPWNAEKLWQPQSASTPAYLLPPLGNIAAGPSGLTYHPGVAAIPDCYRDHFFLVDFRGGSSGSGVHSFALKPKGASFELTDKSQFVWDVLATDAEFGPDGGFYILDWVEGWGLNGKGRVYKVFDPKKAVDPLVAETKKLLNEGMEKRGVAELAKLLAHADLRVRREAHFTLADRGDGGIKALQAAATKDKDRMARLHGIWGLGMAGRKQPAALQPIPTLLSDADSEVRAQAAKVAGECRLASAGEALTKLLADPEPRVRLFAALGLGQLGRKEAIPAILQMLRDNADQDAYLRHAGVMALVGCQDPAALDAASKDPLPAVRMGVLLAWRRLANPEVARFLQDADSRLVLEAARAINDQPVAALPKLAGLIQHAKLADALGYRVLNAHFRIGKPENALALAQFAGRADVSENLRIEALRMLADWPTPSGRDRVIGVWRPLPLRPEKDAADAVRVSLGAIFSGGDKVRQEGAKLAGKYGIKEVGPTLLAMVEDAKGSTAARVDALQALAALKDERWPQAVKRALADADPRVRHAGRETQAQLDPANAIPGLIGVLDKGDMIERQGAFAILGGLKGDAIDTVLDRWLDRLLEGKVSAEMQLDLLEAAAKHPAQDIQKKLLQFEANRSPTDHLAKFRETLTGGDVEAGRQVFLYKREVQCLRCHKLRGEGGEVGPELAGIAAKQNREYLLESLVDPNKQIAKGFETQVIVTRSGRIVTGITREENGKEVRLITPDGQLITVAKNDIDERATGKSAMPEDVVKYLSKREIRDLVEFLAGQK